MRPSLRRDGGFSPSRDGGGECPERLEVDLRDSVDSGVGSPSLTDSWRRTWGRRCNRQTELRKVELIKDALQELSEIHGGEIKFMYKPRSHPNLKFLKLSKTLLNIPQKDVEDHLPDTDWTYSPGYFLARTGLTAEDVLEKRLPNMPEGGLAVVSNGLAIDLYRTAKSKEAKEKVALFIFNFLELKFPEDLVDEAILETLEHIKQNLKYLEECEVSECASFLFTPFCVPAEVCEMASTLEDLEDAVQLRLQSIFAADRVCLAGGSSSAGHLVSQHLYSTPVFLQDRITTADQLQVTSHVDVTTRSSLNVCHPSNNITAELESSAGQRVQLSADDCAAAVAQDFEVSWTQLPQADYSMTSDCTSLNESADDRVMTDAMQHEDLKLQQNTDNAIVEQQQKQQLELQQKQQLEHQQLELRTSQPPAQEDQKHDEGGQVCKLNPGKRSSRTRNVQLPSRFRDYETSQSPAKAAKPAT